MEDTPLTVGPHTFRSRLLLGTGKYATPEIMVRCHRASRTDCVTVAVRRVDFQDASARNFFNHIDRKAYKILPNTAACFTVDDAVRTARMARELGLSDMIKLEVIGDEKTLYPDLPGLIEATRVLVREGFVVLPYTSDDVITALRLEDAGAACVMPLAAPIGSGLGILNPLNLQIIKERVKCPVIVDAGVGTASDVSVAMELGMDGVLLNTAVAQAQDPEAMARAVGLACEAGRLASRAGRIPQRAYATPSSPTAGRIG
jgi:thiazole synthase